MLVYAQKGDSIWSAIEKVQNSLLDPEEYLDLEFNEIRIRVTKNSNANDLATIYDLKHTIRRLKAGYKE